MIYAGARIEPKRSLVGTFRRCLVPREPSTLRSCSIRKDLVPVTQACGEPEREKL